MSTVTKLKAALQRAAHAVAAPGWAVRLEYVTGAYGVEVHAERPGFARQVFSTRYRRPASDEEFAAWLRACLAELAGYGDSPARANYAARERAAAWDTSKESLPAGEQLLPGPPRPAARRR